MNAIRRPLPRCLIVDDEPSIHELLGRVIEDAGFEVVASNSGSEALDYLAEHHVDLAAVDLRMPGINGLDVLRAIREADPDCRVLLMSGQATMEDAVDAIKLGAIDCLTKPFDFARLRQVLNDTKEDCMRRRRLLEAEHGVAKSAEFCGMIGAGPSMQHLFALIRRLAPHVRVTLIVGETGTGKELVARALHHMGPRRDKRFVTINCSAVVESLFESEVFGHARGAFTGATENKPGLFEAAHGGTLFLDEIGELPHSMQAKLLRVLESGEVQRVGTSEPRRVDVHIVAATNRDLRAEAEALRFRSDLYYRLSVVELMVPPLRERREDIPYLTAAFVRDFAKRLGKPIAGVTAAAERKLAAANWNGNVRELRNVVERACIMADGEFIAGPELACTEKAIARNRVLGEDDETGLLSALERDQIMAVLERTGGNKARAAKILGLNRRSLYRRLTLYGISAESTG
jgi:DNA-binding NtrC family response regulator